MILERKKTRRRTSQRKKVWMVTYEFSGYTMVWWNQYYREVREGRRRHIDRWPDLKREMRSRFLPTSYAWDLHNKL
ncbi:hypothetical protein CR513_16164, partial [Mucuna pruriens]